MKNVSSLYDLAKQDDIPIDYFPLRKREAVSLMDISDGKCYIAIDPSKLSSEIDEMMKLAHELGHCETGSFYNIYAICDVRRKCENRADKWAVKNIISVEELDEAIANGYTEIWSLAEYFGVCSCAQALEERIAVYPRFSNYGNSFSAASLRFM
jgi:hypothetical protein